jgi:hypothetical protein
MNIEIHDTNSLSSVQQSFNSVFPYLKIEFFTNLKSVSGRFQRKVIEKYIQTFGEHKKTDSFDPIVISPEMTIADLDQQLQTAFGMSVKLYRYSGRLWLETSVTDSWSLEQQNKEGEALSFRNGDVG